MTCWRCGIELGDDAFQWLVRGSANVIVPVCCDDRTCGIRMNRRMDKHDKRKNSDREIQAQSITA